MDLFSDQQKAALEDGASSLRYRAERLETHPLYLDRMPHSGNLVEAYKRHAAILEEMVKASM